MTLHIPKQPRKCTHQRAVYIQPMPAKARQAERILTPHQADRRNHGQTTGVAGGPPFSQDVERRIPDRDPPAAQVSPRFRCRRPSIDLPVLASVHEALPGIGQPVAGQHMQLFGQPISLSAGETRGQELMISGLPCISGKVGEPRRPRPGKSTGDRCQVGRTERIFNRLNHSRASIHVNTKLSLSTLDSFSSITNSRASTHSATPPLNYQRRVSCALPLQNVEPAS